MVAAEAIGKFGPPPPTPLTHALLGNFKAPPFPAYARQLDLNYIQLLTFMFHRGNAGEEVIDEDFRFTNARRRTNSSGFADNIGAFKTKFDVNEPEPVFEESIHGPSEEDGEDLTKTESSESGRSSAYGDEKITKH